MRLRPLPAMLPVVLVVLLVAALLAAGSTPAAARVQVEGEPAPDFARLPARCFDVAQPGEPARPTACHVTRFDRTRPTLVLLGDSHAQQYLPAIRQAVVRREVNLVAFVSGGCPPVWVPRRSAGYPHCEAKNRAALEWVRARRDAGRQVSVLVGSAWSRWRQLYREVVAEERAGLEPGLDEAIVRLIKLAHEATPDLFRSLGRLGVPVDVIGQSGVHPVEGRPPCPEGEHPYRCPLPRSAVLRDEAATTAYLARLTARLRGPSSVIDTSGAYCDADVCLGTVDGVPSFYDGAHLSRSLTRTMAAYFQPVADRAAALP